MICLQVQPNGSLHSLGQYVQGMTGCDLFGLDATEAAGLAALDAVAPWYAPITPEAFVSLASQGSGVVLVAFLASYFVGVLVAQVK